MGVNEIDYRGLSAAQGLNNGLQMGAALGGMYRKNRLEDDELSRRDRLEAEAAEKQKQKEALELMYRDALHIQSLPTHEAKLAALDQRIAGGGITGDMVDSEKMRTLSPEAFNQEIAYVINRLAPLESLMKKDGGYTLSENQKRYDANGNVVASNVPEETGPDLPTISGINKEITPLISETQKIANAAAGLDKLKSVNSAAAKLAAVFKFMKALDPTSTVREVEQDQVYAAGGLASEIAAKLNSLQGKGGLTDEVFQDLVDTAKSLANSAVERSQSEINNYLGVYDGLLGDEYTGRIRSRLPKPFDIAPKPQTPKPNESQIPVDLPDGTIKNGDGTFTLPNGTIVRKRS